MSSFILYIFVKLFDLLNERFRYMAVSDERQRIMPSFDDRKRGVPLDYPEAVRLTHPSISLLKGEVLYPFYLYNMV